MEDKSCPISQNLVPHVRGDLVSGTGYGYQWWRGRTKIGNREIEEFYAIGHGWQFIVVIPGVQAVVVITIETDDNNLGDFVGYSALENYIIPAVFNLNQIFETPPFEVENYRRITGKYYWPGTKLKLKIFIEQGKLYGLTVLLENKFQMFPIGQDRFLCISDDLGKFRLDAKADSKGNITDVKLIIGFSNLSFEKAKWYFIW